MVDQVRLTIVLPSEISNGLVMIKDRLYRPCSITLVFYSKTPRKSCNLSFSVCPDHWDRFLRVCNDTTESGNEHYRVLQVHFIDLSWPICIRYYVCFKPYDPDDGFLYHLEVQTTWELCNVNIDDRDYLLANQNLKNHQSNYQSRQCRDSEWKICCAV
jgi:hypothetical protein